MPWILSLEMKLSFMKEEVFTFTHTSGQKWRGPVSPKYVGGGAEDGGHVLPVGKPMGRVDTPHAVQSVRLSSDLDLDTSRCGDFGNNYLTSLSLSFLIRNMEVPSTHRIP